MFQVYKPIVVDFLDETFLNLWIERDGSTPKSTRSPDITPPEFFLLDYIKNRTYAMPIIDCDELMARMQASMVTVIKDMLQNTWREVEYRSDIFRATKGAHVEIY